MPCTPAIPTNRMAEVRRRVIFECCKWDPQVGDINVLADFAVVLSSEQWNELRALAEALYAETFLAELEIAGRWDLLKRVALPQKLARVLRNGQARMTAADNAVRVMRFDFHPVLNGWRVTEVNSDVPGGYIEAVGFAELMREELLRVGIELLLAGNPAEKIAECLRENLTNGGHVALVHATAYTDDLQVMMFLQRFFEKYGFTVTLSSPDQIVWRDGASFIYDGMQEKKIDAIFRFFPAEWLPNLDGDKWKNFFLPAKFPRTLLINPGNAIVSQTKCFPFAWSGLASGAPDMWSRLIPETRPLDGTERGWLTRLFKLARLPDDAEWLLKPALGRVGEDIGFSGVTPLDDLARIRKECQLYPLQWVAQRKFKSAPVLTPHGNRHICIGVYVINGCACGIYGRISQQPLINHLAQDVAVLVKPE